MVSSFFQRSCNVEVKVEKDSSNGEDVSNEMLKESPKSNEAKESSSQPNASKAEEEESAEARQKRLMAKFWKPRRSMAYRLKGMVSLNLITQILIKVIY